MIANDTATRAIGNTPTCGEAAWRSSLWVAQIALGVMFLFAGGAKLVGAPAMVNLFAAIGLGRSSLRHWCNRDQRGGGAADSFGGTVRGHSAGSDDVRCGDSQSVHWPVTGCTARAVARRSGSCMDPSQPAPGCVLSLKPTAFACKRCDSSARPVVWELSPERMHVHMTANEAAIRKA